jgi:hypothetical protein
MGRLASHLAGLSWTILVVLVSACQGGHPPLPPDAGVVEPADIKASSDTVAIPPGGNRLLVFYLSGAQGEPVPDAVMNFEILDINTPGSGGAKLSLSSGLTDEQGAVTLQIIAGTGSDDQKPLAFKVRASVADRACIVPVFVTSGALASAEIVPQVAPPDGDITSISLTFYDDTVCADVPWTNPPSSYRPIQTVALGSSYLFTGVVASGFHAVLALAMGARDRVIAKGCADLPGNSLTPSQAMRVFLPLTRLRVSPLGTYKVIANFEFPQQQADIASVRDQWKVLSARICDPASLWLDCTIDALSGDSAADPLDCQPVPEGEGELGARLSDKRSAPGAARICPGQVDPSGKVSLDAKVNALFPSDFLASLSLAKLPDQFVRALAQLSLRSTLTVAESGLANVLDIEHALDDLTLSTDGTPTTVPTEMLGLPIRDVWFASPQPEAGGLLALSTHSFTLHLGSLARRIYYTTSLVSRSGIADANAFVSALFNGAGRNTGSTMLLGCDALDSLLCDEANMEHGCIRAACQTGLEKLAQRLDASFAVLDGPGLDFSLQGTAQLIDSNDDKQADALAISLMTASFKTRTPTTVYGSWSAERISPASP